MRRNSKTKWLAKSLRRNKVPAASLGAGAAGTVALGSFALGAIAMGAVAIGALAIGRLAVGRLSVGRVHLREARIDRLSIGVLEMDDAPAPAGNAAQAPEAPPVPA